ncbi:ABC transporter ATP-binding protein [uncultured Desulfovibrio sp.]|uniref:ABC transporter ATP-binding protein n=1 Tax=uncultured Desulfovibrio sp. TaxID=167968 RepID=UPI0028048445|nr:ABC transporter ATP-binding protein [uncultured Desulfovibrio sp.]
MKPIISVEGLGKSYTIRHEGQTHYRSLREEIFKLPGRLLKKSAARREEFWALRDVNFDIMPGERVGIIGRNGAGKSTLLKLLSRITVPTTGRITLRGRVASLLEVGTGFHPELTGRENIFLNGAILGMSRAEVRRKFDEIVDFAGVEKFLDTPVKRYSSGMYVRLAFAVAAHLEPEILIVDEVLAVGDAEFQKKCLGKMEEVGKEGRTVLFVSHNMAAVRQLCTVGIYLKEGAIINQGDIGRIILDYSSENEKNKESIFDLKNSSDDIVEFVECGIWQNGERCTGKFDIAVEAKLRLKYRIKKRVSGFRIHVDIENALGMRLVRSFNSDGEVKLEERSPGTYISEMTIPAYFLGPKNYRIIVGSSIFNQRSCAGGFSASISPVCSGNWCGPYHGDVFRAEILAHLPWVTKEHQQC